MKTLMARIANAWRDLRRRSGCRNGLAAIWLAAAFSLWSVPAIAQGCAMCYATARATPKDGQRALNRAILLMVLPPIGAITLGTRAAIRYSRKRDQEKEDSSG
jgi:hypothetical protein